MKQTWRDHSAFHSDAGTAKILIDPLLFRDNGWSNYLMGKDSIQGGDR